MSLSVDKNHSDSRSYQSMESHWTEPTQQKVNDETIAVTRPMARYVYDNQLFRRLNEVKGRNRLI